MEKYYGFTLEQWQAILPALRKRNAKKQKRLETIELGEVRKQEVLAEAVNYYSKLKAQREQRRY